LPVVRVCTITFFTLHAAPTKNKKKIKLYKNILGKIVKIFKFRGRGKKGVIK